MTLSFNESKQRTYFLSNFHTQTSKSETVTSAELKTQISDLEIIIEQLETECKVLQTSKETDSEQVFIFIY